MPWLLHRVSGYVDPFSRRRRTLTGRTCRMDTCPRSQSLRAATSCPTGKFAGALRFSKRCQRTNPPGRVLPLQELLLRAGDVSLPALSKCERRLLELAASGGFSAAIGWELRMRGSPLARVDQPVGREVAAGERWGPPRARARLPAESTE